MKKPKLILEYLCCDNCNYSGYELYNFIADKKKCSKYIEICKANGKQLNRIEGIKGVQSWCPLKRSASDKINYVNKNKGVQDE